LFLIDTVNVNPQLVRFTWVDILSEHTKTSANYFGELYIQATIFSMV